MPGVSVGPFRLGMPLADAVRAIAARRSAIPEASVVFYPPDPLAADIVVALTSLGFVLRFAAASQMLKSISITRLDVLQFRYCGEVFRCEWEQKQTEKAHFCLFSRTCSRPTWSPTLRDISKQFGPTYPGELSKEANEYVHNYPGIAFIFDWPPAEQPAESHDRIVSRARPLRVVRSLLKQKNIRRAAGRPAVHHQAHGCL